MNEKIRAAVVIEPGKVKIVHDVPKPVPGEYEALVRNHTCGFCSGTDMQIINGTMEKEEGLGAYPTILGHESSGEVVQLGSKVRYIEIGDRFLHPYMHMNPGGGYTRTYGCMCDYGLVADHKAMMEDGFTTEDLPYKNIFGRLPKDMDFCDGSVVLSLIESHSAVRNFGVTVGMDVLVYGAGTMGLSIVSFLRIAGVRSITLVDGNDNRLNKAIEIAQVEKTINYRQSDVEKKLKGMLFDAAIDVAGSTQVLLQASNHIKPGGKVCSLGVLKKADRIIDIKKLKNNTSLHMLNNPYKCYDSLNEVISMISKGIINPKNYYSHVMPIEDIERGIELIRNREALKVIFTFDTPENIS